MSNKAVEVVEYDELWPAYFESLRRELRYALGAVARAVYHIGSTSISGMRAKPVIDVLVDATDLHVVDELAPKVERLGYTARGEHGIPGRRYFSRSETAGTPAVHVHVFRGGNPHLLRHLQFRDFLRNHPDEAREYSELKTSLATAHPSDRDAYQEGKADFIEGLDRKAAAWASASAPAHVR